ncbi:hypothetical protein ABVT39_006818 [Epinephelus coioides]
MFHLQLQHLPLLHLLHLHPVLQHINILSPQTCQKNLTQMPSVTPAAVNTKTLQKELWQCPQTLRTAGVNATLGIGFNGTVPIAQLPSNAEVIRTFADALNNSNNTFNVTVNPNSLTVLAPTTAATTTAAPTTSPPTTAATTTVALITIRVTFRSLQSTFTTDLLNPSSTAFKQRAAMIKGQLDPVFHKGFPSSFKSLVVLSFSEGSIITIMDVSFVNTSAPNNTQIGSVLINASSTVTGFDIEGSSITVDGIVSGGVIHGISLVTASCLVLLSWLLSNQQ